MSQLNPELRSACISGKLEDVQRIYADLEFADHDRRFATLLEMACTAARAKQSQILEFCCRNGVTVSPKNANDPLLIAAINAQSKEIYQVLMDHGFDVNQTTEVTGDALVGAAVTGDVSLADFLLRNGADPKNGNFYGEWEALVWAIAGDNRSTEMVRLLLDHGAEIRGGGALIAAAEHGNLDATRLLVERGAVLEEVEEYGMWDGRKVDDMGTALYKAAAKGKLHVVRFLIERGANKHFKDKLGREPLTVAEANGHEDVVALLKEQDAKVENVGGESVTA